MHEATGDILREILQARLDHRVIGPDFPRDPLGLFIYLTGNRRLLTTQHVLISTAYHAILIDRKLEEHVGVTLFLLGQSPDSERQPIWLLVRCRWCGCGGLG